MARIEADPIGLEIMWSRMINIAEECWQTVIRTAFSLIIGEAQDFACEILDARGPTDRPFAASDAGCSTSRCRSAGERDDRTVPARDPDAGATCSSRTIPGSAPAICFDIAIAVPVFRDGKVGVLLRSGGGT